MLLAADVVEGPINDDPKVDLRDGPTLEAEAIPHDLGHESGPDVSADDVSDAPADSLPGSVEPGDLLEQRRETNRTLSTIQSYMQSLGLESIDQLGTIYVERHDESGGSIHLSPGIHVLRPVNPLGGQPMDPPSPSTWGESESTLQGTFETDDGPVVEQLPIDVPARTRQSPQESRRTPTPPASSSAVATPIAAPDLEDNLDDESDARRQPGTVFQTRVVRYTGSQVQDEAVILAKKVIFDEAVLELSENITEFFIVAETIESSDGSRIEWALSNVRPDPQRPADDGDPAVDYSHNTVTSHSSANSPDGGDGDDGDDGENGTSGLPAPDVTIVLKSFTLEPNTSSATGSYQASLPDIDVSGQPGGTGGAGGNGADGGDGAKGWDAEPYYVMGVPTWCDRRVG